MQGKDVRSFSTPKYRVKQVKYTKRSNKLLKNSNLAAGEHRIIFLCREGSAVI